MKVLFMGTPEFAVASLNALLHSNHTVVGVVTQPDRAHKHGKMETSPVKKFAGAAGIHVFQPERIRNNVKELMESGADIAVTAAYGQILNADVLNAFPCGVINVHASLLPKYRGASPIQSAIANGEKYTGVTIMRTELGLDTGDILLAEQIEIGETETSGELTERLAVLGAKLLIKTLDNYDRITPVPQDDSLATHCKTISKDEQYIDFSADCVTIANKIRALSPRLCAKIFIDGESYKLYNAVPCEYDGDGAVGEVICTKDEMLIVCGKGAIRVKQIQAPSKRAMPIADFLRGKKFRVGVVCARQP